MVDFILVDGDKAIFQPTFGAATVVVMPGTLKGSGPGTLKRKKLCVAGDEDSVEVQGCVYIAPPYVIPGTGTLKIKKLRSDQKARQTKTGKKLVLLKGKMFDAKFEVQSPAKMPRPPLPPADDATPQYSGSGSFTTTNTIFRGI